MPEIDLYNVFDITDEGIVPDGMVGYPAGADPTKADPCYYTTEQLMPEQMKVQAETIDKLHEALKNEP